MAKLEFKGDWNVTTGSVKQKLSKLTDDDIQYAQDHFEEWLNRFQKRTGETREAVEMAIKKFCSSNAPPSQKP